MKLLQVLNGCSHSERVVEAGIRIGIGFSPKEVVYI